MAKLGIVALMAVLVTVLGSAVAGLKAQSICNMSQDGLMACKPAVTGGTSPVDPSDACCTALASADLVCLCSYKNSMFLPSFGIDPKRAMQLPRKCNLTTPVQCEDN